MYDMFPHASHVGWYNFVWRNCHNVTSRDAHDRTALRDFQRVTRQFTQLFSFALPNGVYTEITFVTACVQYTLACCGKTGRPKVKV